ncbi:hypothetical protein O181_067278 [Austropuccinia psidii MF-1]|uniref:Uracil-DNA glycosylase n=1 Tax=Austropuccinia psidii MF-1 TaxID=1389203 RepID=A0A9Q3EYI8_9BASI|nr:hypothetical protein [Austropuccinia psidii MF-1]
MSKGRENDWRLDFLFEGFFAGLLLGLGSFVRYTFFAMGSTTAPKLGDKRQRSIADMFGAKPQASVSGSTSSISSSRSTNTAKSAATLTTAKNATQKGVKTNRQITHGRLTRVSYQKLPPVDHHTCYTTLSDEFRKLLALELDAEHGLGGSYLRVLRPQLTQNYFLDLKRFLLAEGLGQPRNDIYPSPNNIYHWSRATPLDQVKVVIIGQDPYHGPGQAHGLSFSVPKGIPIPGSLRNIHDELKREYPDFKKPSHGSLRSWAQSGVLLLNTSLTVKKAQAGSHSNRGWEQFTDAVVEAIDLYGGLGLLGEETKEKTAAECEHDSKRAKVESKTVLQSSENLPDSKLASLAQETASADSPSQDSQVPSSSPAKASEDSKLPFNCQVIQDVKPGFGKGVVFLCWGKWAADRVARLSDSKHLILKSAHPSPLSAHRGFLGNDHFRKANEWLESRYGKSAQIDWCRLNPE